VGSPDGLLPLLSSAAPDGLFGYVGLGPGQEFLPYFLALLAWVATSLIAVLRWPLLTLFRRLRGVRGTPQDVPQNVLAPGDTPALPEEAGRNQQ
jgi:hypothetical protein